MDIGKKTIWIIIDHPMQIINAIGLALYLQDKYIINLLISRHHYWNKSDQKIFSEYFKKIYWFPKVDFSWILPREALKIIYIKLKLKHLGIKNEDIFLSLANKIFLENILFSLYPKNSRISLDDDYIATHIERGQKEYHETLFSIIWNKTLIPLFKIKSMIFLQCSAEPLYIIVYQEEIFDNKYLFKRFKPGLKLSENELYRLAPLVRNNINGYSKNQDLKTIVFFGEGRDYFDADHFKFVNQCLRYIEKFFTGYSFVFKPHPYDRMEIKNIDFGKFQIYTDKNITELFLLKNADKIAYCFSVSSTSIRSSIDFGIKNSYYFLKLYRNYVSDKYYNILIEQVGDTDHRALIKSFDSAPENYGLDIKVDEIQRSLQKLDNYLLTIL